MQCTTILIDDGIIGVVSWDSAKETIIESGYCTSELQGVGYSIGYECYLILILAWQAWPVLAIAAMLNYIIIINTHTCYEGTSYSANDTCM